MSIERPDPAISEAEADARMAARHDDIMATLAKADHRMRLQDYRGASAFYGAVGRLAMGGVAIEHSELLRARDAALWLDGQFGEMLREGLAKAGLGEGQRHPRLQKAIEIMRGERRRDPEATRYPQVPQTFYYPDMPLVDFADPSHYPWREAIEAQTETILFEGRALMADPANFLPYMQQTKERPQGDVHGLLGNPDWRTCYLTDKGQPIPERVALAPVTFSALDQTVPLCRIGTRAPSIKYSLLRAHSNIPAHSGMVNCRFVCHLPLMVPEHCGFRVGATTREWSFAELMVFDDSVEHEAWNNSDHDRLVLIFDVWRSELSEEERRQIEALFRVVDTY